MFSGFLINLLLKKFIGRGKELLRDNLGKPIDFILGDEHMLKPKAMGTKVFDHFVGQDQDKELRLYMFLVRQDR